MISFIELGIYLTVYLRRNYKEELKNSVKVDSFSKRATLNVKNIQEKVIKELQGTLRKY